MGLPPPELFPLQFCLARLVLLFIICLSSLNKVRRVHQSSCSRCPPWHKGSTADSCFHGSAWFWCSQALHHYAGTLKCAWELGKMGTIFTYGWLVRGEAVEQVFSHCSIKEQPVWEGVTAWSHVGELRLFLRGLIWTAGWLVAVAGLNWCLSGNYPPFLFRRSLLTGNLHLGNRRNCCNDVIWQLA